MLGKHTLASEATPTGTHLVIKFGSTDSFDGGQSMILIVDNYDSFTYNLVQRLGEIDPQLDIQVYRNDKITVDEIIELNPARVIISPGPCTPDEAGISLRCAKQLTGELPVLGVCLGHQSIAQAFGAKIVRAGRLMHGKTDMIHHDGLAPFEGIDSPLEATRYHSLIVQPDTLPDEFVVSAWAESPDGQREIMGIRHREYPVFGLQFHPESFLTASGTQILTNFLAATATSEPKA